MHSLFFKKLARYFLVAVSFFAIAYASAADTSFEGLLREKGTRKPLEGVNVFILPHRLKATTDAQGRFQFAAVPAGEFQWVINFTGYNRLEQKDNASTESSGTAPIKRDFFLEKTSYQVYETTIYGKEKKRDTSQRSIKREQFLTVPGAGGDPIKAVQNLPGINRPAPFQAQVLIQGAGPQDTRYLIEGHEVPLIFHFGGLSSVVFPEALDRVDTLAAGYGPEWGRANGGLVGVWTKKPETDRLHGQAFVDIFNSGLLLEGPIGEKSSFLLSGRQSYIGFVLKQVAKNSEDFNLTVAPTFSDLTAIVQSEVTPRDDFKFTFTGSKDNLRFLLSEPVKQNPSIRGDFESETAFFRLIPQLTHRHSEIAVTRFSLGIGKDFIKFINGENYFYINSTSLTARGEWEQKFAPFWTSYLGFDNRYNWSHVTINLPSFTAAGGIADPVRQGSNRTRDIQGEYHRLGFYWRHDLKPTDTPWTFSPGMRLDRYILTKEWLAMPRGAIRYDWDESLQLRTSGGLYYQPPQEQESDSTFGNSEIQSPRAWHATAGFEKDFRQGSSSGWIAALDGFYKALDQLILPSSKTVVRDNKTVAENFNNDGRGRVIGAQTSIRLEQNPWSASLAYTLSQSTRWNLTNTVAYPYQYDQTHSIGLLGSYQVGNWKFSSRFRYATGNPQTPVLGGIWDADNDVYTPVRGPYFSTRLDPFYQLDMRIDYKFVFDTWILSAYLDIQNLTNRQNPEQIVYSYDYSRKTTISGLPVIPLFGLKGEF